MKEHLITGPFNDEMATGVAFAAMQGIQIVNEFLKPNHKIGEFAVAIAEIQICGVWHQVRLTFDPKKSNFTPINEVSVKK